MTSGKRSMMFSQITLQCGSFWVPRRLWEGGALNKGELEAAGMATG